MLIYRDRTGAAFRTPPPWLVGASDLVEREDGEGRLWAIGDGLRVGGAPDSAWTDLEGGWQVRREGDVEGHLLARRLTWCPVTWASDQEGRRWAVPQVLGADGTPRIAYRYGGPQWLPQATPEQALALEIAQAARTALLGSPESVPRSAACQWTAELLALANHVPVAVLQVVGAIDDTLIKDALTLAIGAAEVSRGG